MWIITDQIAQHEVRRKEKAPAHGGKPMDKKWWTLVAVCTGTFMLLLDVTIVTVAQPAIQGGLHASFSDVQWVLDAYALTLASLLCGLTGKSHNVGGRAAAGPGR